MFASAVRTNNITSGIYGNISRKIGNINIVQKRSTLPEKLRKVKRTNSQDQPVKTNKNFSKTQQNVSSKDKKIEILLKEVQLSKQAQNENKFCKFQTKLNENNKNVINGSKNVKIASSSGCQTDKNAELIKVSTLVQKIMEPYQD